MAPSPPPHLPQFPTIPALGSGPRVVDGETEYVIRAKEGERQFGDDRSGRIMAPSPSPNLIQGEMMFLLPERFSVREDGVSVAAAAAAPEPVSNTPKKAADNFLEQLDTGGELDQEIANGMEELEWLGPRDNVAGDRRDMDTEKNEVVFHATGEDEGAAEKERQSDTPENKRHCKTVSFSPKVDYLPQTSNFTPETNENLPSPTLLPNRWDFTPTYNPAAIFSTQALNPTLGNFESRAQEIKDKREQLARTEAQTHKQRAKMTGAYLAKKGGGVKVAKRRTEEQLVKDDGDVLGDVEEAKQMMDRVQLEAIGRKIIPLASMGVKKSCRGPSRRVVHPSGGFEPGTGNEDVSTTPTSNPFSLFGTTVAPNWVLNLARTGFGYGNNDSRTPNTSDLAAGRTEPDIEGDAQMERED